MTPVERLALLLAIAGGMIVAPGPAAAERVVQTLTLHERLDHNWENELVFFPLEAKAAKAMALIGPDGKEMPYQLATANGKTRIAFLADLPAGARQTYRLEARRRRSRLVTDLRWEETAGSLRLSTALTGIETPTAAGSYRQGPLARVRLRSGRWIGGSRLSVKREIVRYEARATARGPVYGEIESTYSFADGKTWRIRFRLIAGEPAIVVDESFDLADDSRWELLFHPDFKPDHAFYRPSNDKAPNKGKIYQNTVFRINYAGDRQPLVLCPWLPWSSPGHCSFFGVFQAPPGVRYYRDAELKGAARTVPPAAPGKRGPNVRGDAAEDVRLEDKEDEPPPQYEDLLAAAAGHAGDWARPGENGNSKFLSLRASASGELYLSLPLVGPGRRWVLGALTVRQSVVPDKELSAPQRLMNKYCETPLDEVKDMVLEWPAPPIVYPRLVLDQPEAERLRQAGGLKFSRGDPRRRAVKEVAVAPAPSKEQLGWAAARVREAMKTAVSNFVPGLPAQPSHAAFTHHVTQRVGHALGAADLALSSGAFTPEEQQRIRAQLAFIAYKMSSPHFYSPPRGFRGLVNMTTSWNSINCLLACIVPHHPKAKAWAAQGLKRIAGQLARCTGPNGGWVEAPHYQTVAMADIIYLALATRGAGFADYVYDERLKQAINYLAKMSTPPDPRFNNRRHFPPVGNTYLLETTMAFTAMAKLYRERDPEFANDMQWTWIQQGRPERFGIGGAYPLDYFIEFLVSDLEPKRPPAWTSELFPGTGAVMRSGFPGERETYLYYIGGPLHQHYDDDQGSVTLWGKGRPLCLDWGYSGRAPAWQHNRLDIGGGGKVSSFAAQPSADYLHGRLGSWERQILFVKDADPLGPNYFVVRDTTQPAERAANWWLWVYTKQDLEAKGNVVHAVGQDDVDLDIWLNPPTVAELPRKSVRTLRQEAAAKKGPAPPADPQLREGEAVAANLEVDPTEGDRLTDFVAAKDLAIRAVQDNSRGYWHYTQTHQKGLRIPVKMGETLVCALYPRLRGERPPVFESLAGGKVLRVESPAGTDYVFLAKEKFAFEQGEIVFKGIAGAIQVRGKKVVLTLAQGGVIGYGKRRLEAAGEESRQFDL